MLLCVAGKTTTSQLVAEAGGLRYINVGDWVKEQDLHSGFDEEHQAFIIDEDKVGEAAAALQNKQGWHGKSSMREGCSLY